MSEYKVNNEYIVELTHKATELDVKAVIYQVTRGQISKGDAFFKFSDIEKRRDELLKKHDKVKRIQKIKI